MANGVAPGIVVPSSVPVLGTLRINNPSSVSLVADLTVDVTLDLAAGHLDTGSSVVTIGPAGAVVRGTGWVNGQLQKPVTNGTNVAVTFEIGDATAYAPADVVFDNVVIGGLLTGSTTGAITRQLASSPIYPLMSVNRYWTLTNNGIAFGTYDLTLVWVPADIDVAATTSSFIVGKLRRCDLDDAHDQPADPDQHHRDRHQRLQRLRGRRSDRPPTWPSPRARAPIRPRPGCRWCTP